MQSYQPTPLKQSGFSVIEVLVVVLIFAVLATCGIVVYQRHRLSIAQNDAGIGPSHTVTQPKNAEPAPVSNNQNDNYVNVPQGSNIIQESPKEVAKTTDQANILTALHNTCSDSSKANVTIDPSIFDDDNVNFQLEGNYAVINAAACDSAVRSVNALSVDARAYYLHKDSSGIWVYDASTIGLPVDCTRVDGLGYPSTILATCYDSVLGNNRSPK